MTLYLGNGSSPPWVSTVAVDTLQKDVSDDEIHRREVDCVRTDDAAETRESRPRRIDNLPLVEVERGNAKIIVL